MKKFLCGLILLVPIIAFSQDTTLTSDSSLAWFGDSAVEVSSHPTKEEVKKPVKKKWVAALLAFPLVGITGAHRVYLGTEPWMPLVYLGTLGGFGILPLIDFFVILFTPKEKMERYYDDAKVFMWGE